MRNNQKTEKIYYRNNKFEKDPKLKHKSRGLFDHKSEDFFSSAVIEDTLSNPKFQSSKYNNFLEKEFDDISYSKENICQNAEENQFLSNEIITGKFKQKESKISTSKPTSKPTLLKFTDYIKDDCFINRTDIFCNEKSPEKLDSLIVGIEEKIKSKYNLIIPALSVELHQEMKLDKADLTTFFKYFGEIVYISIEKLKFYVLYKYNISCAYAYDTLINMVSLKKLNATIVLQSNKMDNETKSDIDIISSTYKTLIDSFRNGSKNILDNKNIKERERESLRERELDIQNQHANSLILEESINNSMYTIKEEVSIDEADHKAINNSENKFSITTEAHGIQGKVYNINNNFYFNSRKENENNQEENLNQVS